MLSDRGHDPRVVWFNSLQGGLSTLHLITDLGFRRYAVRTYKCTIDLNSNLCGKVRLLYMFTLQSLSLT